MPVYKNEDNGTWYVLTRYVDWKGERKQRLKRGFATKKEAQAWERVFMYQRSELDYLIYNDPVAYAELILNVDTETYLKTVTEYKPLDS